MVHHLKKSRKSTPTYLRWGLTFNLDDYGEKERITRPISRAAFWRRLDGLVMSPFTFISVD